jgi:hypothetical protein
MCKVVKRHWPSPNGSKASEWRCRSEVYGPAVVGGPYHARQLELNSSSHTTPKHFVQTGYHFALVSLPPTIQSSGAQLRMSRLVRQ